MIEDDYIPVHNYLSGQHGTPMLELVCLGEISRDAVYEFAFIGGSLKLRGGGCSTNEAHRYPCVLTQLADVDLDHRGLVYASDRSGESCAGQGSSCVGTGLFVFEYTGSNKRD